MRDSQTVGNGTGITNIGPGAACSGPARGCTLIIKLQGDTQRIATSRMRQRSDNRRVNAARHRNSHPPTGERRQHSRGGGWNIKESAHAHTRGNGDVARARQVPPQGWLSRRSARREC
jgi:hypothetical protein